MDNLTQLFNSQAEFQRLAGVKIQTNLNSERIRLAEIFLFKAIEEIIELRRTFPSQLNKWSKSQPVVDMTQTKNELCDSILFLTNFALAMDISPEEIATQLQLVQENNFKILKSKKMDLLNNEILRNPSDPRLGIGNLNPNAVYITQKDGTPPFFSKETEYVTKLVKDGSTLSGCTILGYWLDFLSREIEILLVNNTNCFIAIPKEETELINAFVRLIKDNEIQYYTHETELYQAFYVNKWKTKNTSLAAE